MKTEYTVQARAFQVVIKDQRTGDERSDLVVLDKPMLQAAELVGQSSKDLIYRLYNRQGYRVLEIGKPERRSITVNLDELYLLHSKEVGQVEY
jgi:redox-regulated HSP33 family molecular chaperone